MGVSAQRTQQKGRDLSAFSTTHPRAPELIRIGEEAIAQDNEARLRQYFAPDYVCHGPRGDRDFEALRAYFAALRQAFSELRLTRALILGEGDYLAARTIFSGVFTGVLTLSPAGRLEP